MTYLQLINAVMVRMREPEVTSPTQDEYSKLIGALVNETKREVEDAWNWVQLRSTVLVTTVAGTYSYSLTTAGSRYRVLSVYNDTEDYFLTKGSYEEMNTSLNANTRQRGKPKKYDVNGNLNGDPVFDISPPPDAAYRLNFNLILPQADLENSTDILTVPAYPVILGAWAKAISDRGDDGSTRYEEAMNRYYVALGDAIAIDASNTPENLIWTVG